MHLPPPPGRKPLNPTTPSRRESPFRMPNASRSPARGLFLAIFLGLVFVLVAARYELVLRAPFHDAGDNAVNALQIHNAKHFAEIYGNYSRFEFNHPGPAFFYVYAAGELVFHDLLHLVPAPANAHVLAGIILQSFFFALALALLSTHLPWRALLPLTLLAAALHFGHQHEPFVSIWPPHVLLMPFLCFLVVCTSVATGRVRELPLLVFVGGFLFHGHVAQALFVGLLGTLAVFLGRKSLRADHPLGWREFVRVHRRELGRSALVAAVFLLPLIIDVATRGLRGNVATIIGRFLKNTEEAVTFAQSALYFLSFATPTRDQDILLAKLTPEMWAFFGQHAWRIALWLAILIGPVAWVFARRKQFAAEERRFFLRAGAMLGATVLGCLLWGKAQAGGMHHFNGYFYYTIYFFGLLLALALVARLLERFSLKFAGAAACAFAGAIAALAFRAGAPGEAESSIPIRDGTRQALAADPDKRPKLLVFEHAHWPSAAGVALELQYQGVRFYAGPWWTFMFQPRHDLMRLGAKPEDHASIWWITSGGEGGHAIQGDLKIHPQPAPLDPKGAEIAFHSGGNAFRYVVTGITVGNTDSALTTEKRVVFRFAPQKAAHDVRLSFDAAADNATHASTPAEISFNGQPIGRPAASTRTTVSVTVPVELWNRAPVATLELFFPTAKPHSATRRPDYRWWSGWQIWKIKVDCPGAPAIVSATAWNDEKK